MFKHGSQVNPRIYDKDYLFLKSLANELRNTINEIPGKNLTICDVGSVYKPYRSLFDGNYRRFFSLDVLKTYQDDKPNIIASAEYLPIHSESVDVCLCTQVIEHVNDPNKVIAELSRIIKKGGTLLLSTHGVFHHHPYPHDYWRWTDEGLHKIVHEHFLEVKVYPNGGTLLSLFHIIGRGVFFVSERIKMLRFFQYTLYPLINCAGIIADNLVQDHSLSINYLAVGKK